MRIQREVGKGRFSVEIEVLGEGEPVLFLHGAGGLTGLENFLELLARECKVIAPHLPGFGQTSGEDLIDDVIDAALFYHQVMDDFAIDAGACVIGHSMGGMLAAELAALDSRRARRLVLVSPLGLWLDEHPIPDLFTASVRRLPGLLFHDPAGPLAQLLLAMPSDRKAAAESFIERIRRLTMASKFLWPIPDRGLRKRAWRISSPTMLVWGESDKLVDPAYAHAFAELLADSRTEIIAQAGHMAPYERPEQFVELVRGFMR